MFDPLQGLRMGAKDAGFVNAESIVKVRYVIEVEPDAVVGIKDLEERKESRFHMVPLWSVDRTGGSATGFLIDTPAGFGCVQNTAKGDEKPAQRKKREARNQKAVLMGQDSLQKVQAAAAATKNKGLAAVASALESGLREQLLRLLPIENDFEIDYSGKILFLYRGRYVHQSKVVRRYFNEVVLGPEEERSVQCLLTGKQIKHLINPYPKLYVPGMQNAVPLFFQNNASVEHYNLDKELSYPMERDEAINLLAFTQRLFLDRCPDPTATGRTKKRLPKCHVHLRDAYSIAIWSAQAADVVDVVFDLFSRTGDVLAADKEVDLVTDKARITAGLRLFQETKDSPVLDGVDQHPLFVLGVQGSRGQLAVKDWQSLDVQTARSNLRQHYRDTGVATAGAARPMLFGLKSLLWCSCSKEAKWYEQIPLDVQRQMWRAILLAAPYPTSVVNNAHDRFVREIAGGASKTGMRRAAQIALLRGYLTRNNKESDMPENKQHPAYRLGQLLELGDHIAYLGYRPARGPGQSLLAFATQNPRAVITQLSNKVLPHIDKMVRQGKGGPATNVKKKFADLMKDLGDVPMNFRLHERYLVSIGYWDAINTRFSKKNRE